MIIAITVITPACKLPEFLLQRCNVTSGFWRRRSLAFMAVQLTCEAANVAVLAYAGEEGTVKQGCRFGAMTPRKASMAYSRHLELYFGRHPRLFPRKKATQPCAGLLTYTRPGRRCAILMEVCPSALCTFTCSVPIPGMVIFGARHTLACMRARISRRESYIVSRDAALSPPRICRRRFSIWRRINSSTNFNFQHPW